MSEKKCWHDGKLKDSPQGKRCATCGRVIYLPRVRAGTVSEVGVSA